MKIFTPILLLTILISSAVVQAQNYELKIPKENISEIMDIAYSPKGDQFALLIGKTIFINDTKTGKNIKTLESKFFGMSTRGSIKFSPDSKYLSLVDMFQSISIEIDTGKEIEYEPTFYIYGTEFSPDSRTIAVSCHDNSTKIYGLYSGMLLDSIHGVIGEFSQDGKYLLIYDINNMDDPKPERGYKAYLWELSSRKCVREFIGHLNWINHSEFSSDGKWILTASEDSTIRVWEVSTGKEKLVLKGHKNGVCHASFSSDGKNIVSSSDDLMVHIWSVETGKIKHVLNPKYGPGGHRFVKYSPDNKFIITHTQYEYQTSTQYTLLPKARVWNSTTGELMHILKGDSPQFVSEDKIVVWSEDKRLTFWNYITGEQIIKLYILDDDPDKWVYVSPSGIFDASKKAFEMMCDSNEGLEFIDISKTNELFWSKPTTGLWEKTFKVK